MASTGIVGDTHFEAVHPGYLSFCLDVFDAWRCDTFVHIGDVCNLHNPSVHDEYPGMPGAQQEFEDAYAMVQKWRKHFPKLRVCIGNHDERAVLLASRHRLAEFFLKDYRDLWGTPGWDWRNEHIVDGVFYTHGTRQGAEHPAFTFLKKGLGMSVVLGHNHTKAGIKWLVGPRSRWFAMDVGCGVDRRHPAMAYDRNNALKPIIACGVVVDGQPYLELAPIGPGEHYHRSHFLTKRRRRRR